MAARSKKPVSLIDTIQYDSVRHLLEVTFCYQRFVYMGVPDSIYCRLLSESIPDQVFLRDVFNKYPVVITLMPAPIKRKRKKRKRPSE